jgi:multiple sugar transport system permease protein
LKTPRWGFDAGLLGAALAYLALFCLLPAVYLVVLSFQSVDMFDIMSLSRPFVGFGNYLAALRSDASLLIARNTIVFVVFSVGLQLPIGLALASFFARRFPGSTTMRGLLLAGWIMPGLVVGAIWKWIFAGDIGVLNAVLRALGLPSHIFWLSDPHLSLLAVVIANVWLGVPFNMMLLSVGLASIPAELYEAAAMDGAGAVRSFLSITLPALRATIASVAALGVILTLQQFDLISGLTEGGPANTSNVAQFWSWQLSFEAFEIGTGSAIAVVMLVVVSVVAWFYVRSTRAELAA